MRERNTPLETPNCRTKRPVPGLIEGLATDKGIVYAGTGKALSAFEARTGKLIWRNNDWNQREGTTTTLSVGSGVVIGSVQWSALYANDLKTGKKLWSASNHDCAAGVRRQRFTTDCSI